MLPVILLFLCGSAPADNSTGKPSSGLSGFTLAPQIGTLGIGLNIGYQVSDTFKTRFNMNYMGLNTERTINNIDFNADFTAATFGILADFHPFSGYFRMTGGLYYVDMSLKTTAELEYGKTYSIGNNKYTKAELGRGEGSVKWQRPAPYVGIGFGPGAGQDSAFSASADIGALLIGDPKVSLRFVDSAYAMYSGLAKDTGDYERKSKKEIRGYLPFWPVLSLGVSYRF